MMNDPPSGTMPPPANYLLSSIRRQGMEKQDQGAPKRNKPDDGQPHEAKRRDTDFYKEPAGGLRDPQGEPLRDDVGRDDAITEPTEELPPDGLGKKSPDQDLDKKPRHRGG
jgi:hypothetical protein